MVSHTTLSARFALPALAAASLLLTGATLHSSAHADSSVSATVAVAISDTAIHAPASIAPGIETLNVSNSGAQPHDLSLLRIDDGVSFDQVMAAAAQAASGDPQAQLAFDALVAPAGGVEMVDPGATTSFTVDLTTGDYIAIDLNNAADGDVTRFSVAGAPSNGAVPAADVTVTAVDFGYQMPSTVPAGKTTFAFVNGGTQNHEFGLVRLDPGYTLQDVLAHITDDAPPSWAHVVPGMPDLAPGASEWQTLDLQPGTYVAICFDTDPATGEPHAALGMVGAFTAQ
jgi:hypothetical protein